MGQSKKVKDQTKLEQQLQRDQVEESSPKKSRKRERDQATTEQPDQTSFKRDELDLAKVDKRGRPKVSENCSDSD
jgi:hypothetical protein